MYKTSIALVAALAFVGCGGGGSAATDTTTPTAGTADPTTAPATILELGEMTLFEDGAAMLKIHADGTTEIGQRSADQVALALAPGPTLHADGTIAKETEPRARLNADGTLTAIEGHAKIDGVTITADTLTVTSGSAGTLTVTLSADGTISQTGNMKNSRTMRVEGADTPGKRRAMLTVIALLIRR
jgi:hypothetical protein